MKYVIQLTIDNLDESEQAISTAEYDVGYCLNVTDELIRKEEDYVIDEWILVNDEKKLFIKLPRYVKNEIRRLIEKAHAPAISY